MGAGALVWVLGRDFAGVLQSDCFSAYVPHTLAEWIQQKYFAHLLKAISFRTPSPLTAQEV